MPAALAPGASSGDLLDALARRPCPPPFRSHLRIRVEPKDSHGATLDGSLEVALPETLRLSARLGVFRPLFVLSADSDSSVLLFHETAQYWVSPRAMTDWAQMNPSALGRAVDWALCAGDLAAHLEALGPLRRDSRTARLSARIAGSNAAVELSIDAVHLRLTELELVDPEGGRLGVALGDFTKMHGADVPERIELNLFTEGLRISIEMLGPSPMRRDEIRLAGAPRPQGWTPFDPSRGWGEFGLVKSRSPRP